MDEKLFEIMKIILPAIITGIFSSLITRYTYNKNIPLDKLEIAYNRVYYPIYRLIKDDSLRPKDVIKKSQIYLKKYNKYIDRSTLFAVNYYLKCKNEKLEKKAYENFEDNINNTNEYLRRKLGYLEPSYFTIYRYASPLLKSEIRIICEVIILYLSILTHPIFKNFNFYDHFAYFTLSLFGILIIEILCLILRSISTFIIEFLTKNE